ncbi:MAG TPA: MarR family transcriptional regulator [Arenimonas sp.]|nr:MAG: MarR family transcriptional regulator [Xanthomonadales bacterium GWF1_69_6]HBD21080.1 MarR family transcriptional regulator [Arenimonas sp.]
MPDRDILDLEHFLPYRLSVLSNRISQDIARLYADRFGLGITEWRVLAVLGRHHDIPAREVAERTAMDKVAVSRAIASLQAAGRIERQVRRDDRRHSMLRLSPAGRAIYDEVAPMALAYQRRLLEGLAPDERAALDRLLTRMEELELATRPE